MPVYTEFFSALDTELRKKYCVKIVAVEKTGGRRRRRHLSSASYSGERFDVTTRGGFGTVAVNVWKKEVVGVAPAEVRKLTFAFYSRESGSLKSYHDAEVVAEGLTVEKVMNEIVHPWMAATTVTQQERVTRHNLPMLGWEKAPPRWQAFEGEEVVTVNSSYYQREKKQISVRHGEITTAVYVGDVGIGPFNLLVTAAPGNSYALVMPTETHGYGSSGLLYDRENRRWCSISRLPSHMIPKRVCADSAADEEERKKLVMTLADEALIIETLKYPPGENKSIMVEVWKDATEIEKAVA